MYKSICIGVFSVWKLKYKYCLNQCMCNWESTLWQEYTCHSSVSWLSDEWVRVTSWHSSTSLLRNRYSHIWHLLYTFILVGKVTFIYLYVVLYLTYLTPLKYDSTFTVLAAENKAGIKGQCRDKPTSSHSNPDVKPRRARLVLGWGFFWIILASLFSTYRIYRDR